MALIGWGRTAVGSRARQTIIMSDTTKAPEDENEPAYHLYLDEQEVPVATVAIACSSPKRGARAPDSSARARSGRRPGDAGTERHADAWRSPEQMKIAYSAVRLLLNDLQREQAGEREVLRAILDKLPDEHTMRAIELP